MKLRELKLELTQRCPLACVHCSTDSHRRRASSLSEETVLRILQEACDLGLEKVSFTGGEPLLAPYLARAIQEARRLGVRSSLYTCGAIDAELTPLTRDSALMLADCGLGRFIFSVYSHRADVHNSITRYQSFLTTETAMENAAHSGVPVEIHFVAMRRNFRDLLGLVRAAEQWGVQRVSVLRFVPHGRAAGIAASEDLTPEEMRELRDLIVSTREKHPGVELRAGSPYNVLGIGNTPCDAAQEVLVVNHRGDTFPCDAFKNVAFYDPRFGSVLEHSLKTVWERSAFLNRVREELAARPGPLCEYCSEMHGCKSGCLAQKVIRSGWGDTSEPDPGCSVHVVDEAVPARNLRAPKPVLIQIH